MYNLHSFVFWSFKVLQFLLIKEKIRIVIPVSAPDSHYFITHIYLTKIKLIMHAVEAYCTHLDKHNLSLTNYDFKSFRELYSS